MKISYATDDTEYKPYRKIDADKSTTTRDGGKVVAMSFARTTMAVAA